MSIENALVTDVVTVKPEDTVKSALELLEKNNIRAMPVVDDEGNYLGMFNTIQLLKKLLPHIASENTLPTLDFIQHAAPQIAKRLKEVETTKVRDAMSKEIVPITVSVPHTEAMMRLVRHGSPLPVVHKGSSKFHGLLTEQSMLIELQKIA